MKKLIVCTVFIGIVPSILHAQNNRISVQTGFFHCFFDGSPILNVNYMHKSLKPFNGLLYNSVGLQYTRKINLKNSISAEAMGYYEYYWNIHPNQINNVVTRRTFETYNLNYERNLSLSKRVSFTYGGGVNYRRGLDWIVVGYYGFNSKIDGRSIRDFGINTRAGIEYSPWRWLTLYTKFDLLSIVYANDKKQIERLKEVYNVPNYPTRFDLSWRFGLGFNFGKIRDKKENAPVE